MPFWKGVKKNLKNKIIQFEVKKGDSQAFVWLYDQYAPKIYRFIYLKTNSPQDSEDLTSEVFFKFWRQLEDKEVKVKNPRGFLYQIARNLVVDYYRQKPKAEITLAEVDQSQVENIASGENLKENAVLGSDVSDIKNLLGKIRPQYQDLLIWHFLDDFSVKEMAQILEIPENTVRVKLHRAIKALKGASK